MREYARSNKMNRNANGDDYNKRRQLKIKLHV